MEEPEPQSNRLSKSQRTAAAPAPVRPALALALVPLFFSMTVGTLPRLSEERSSIGDGGPAVSATLRYPSGLALDIGGTLYIADTAAHRIRKVDSRGVITTFAGTGERGFAGDGGPALSARLSSPHDLSFDEEGNLYFADSANHRIRKIDKEGIIQTVVGAGTIGFSGDGGPATKAELNNPQGIAIDRQGNVLIADTFNQVIRKIDQKGVISTIAGALPPGFGGDGDHALKALFTIPHDVATASNGSVYISDTGNSRIRRIDSEGIMRHVAGSGPSAGLFGAGFKGDGGPAEQSQVYSPVGIAFDWADTLFIADSGNNRIRVVREGIISTLAGTGAAGFSGDGGKAIEAELNTPQRLVVDKMGNVYFADTPNHRIRKIDTNGLITTIAGSGPVAGYIYEGSSLRREPSLRPLTFAKRFPSPASPTVGVAGQAQSP